MAQVTAAHYRLQTFFQTFLKSRAQPIGELVDYAIRIEFQARGSPHAHTILWIKDSPKLDQDPDEEVCSFKDRYVWCQIPENDVDLADMVRRVQRLCHLSKEGPVQISLPLSPQPVHSDCP